MTNEQLDQVGNILGHAAKMATDVNNGLPAYRVIYEDGDSYVTSMAKGITLDEAKKYFIGQSFEQGDGSQRQVVNVEELIQ